MGTKTVVVFWASVLASVFLLGGAVSAGGSVSRDPSIATVVILGISVIGLAVAWTIPARIMFVVGREQRRDPKRGARGRRREASPN